MSDFEEKQRLAELLHEVEEQPAAELQHLKSKIESPRVEQDDEILEMGTDFRLDGFQVVRREFFAHLNEPSATFNNCKFYINSACLQKFPDVDYVQVLVNQETKILALMPCPEGARDSFQWCSKSKGRRKPKQITCTLFFAKIFTMMGWNPDYRYKLLGKLIHANDAYLLAFDLTATEVYQRTITEGTKPKTSKTPVFPAEWQRQFGLPFYEHSQAMQINIFDGYAIYAIKEKPKPEQTDTPAAPVSIPSQSEMSNTNATPWK